MRSYWMLSYYLILLCTVVCDANIKVTGSNSNAATSTASVLGTTSSTTVASSTSATSGSTLSLSTVTTTAATTRHFIWPETDDGAYIPTITTIPPLVCFVNFTWGNASWFRVWDKVYIFGQAEFLHNSTQNCTTLWTMPVQPIHHFGGIGQVTGKVNVYKDPATPTNTINGWLIAQPGSGVTNDLIRVDWNLTALNPVNNMWTTWGRLAFEFVYPVNPVPWST